MQEAAIQLTDYLAIFQRRKKIIVITASILFGLCATIAFLLPPSYRSTATILIEEQEIPPELVRAAITSYADQRIESIKQQVLSRATLWKIIEQYDLYPAARRTSTTEDVLRHFTKQINIEVINADVVDRRTQHTTKATIAFTLSYDGDTPDLAQKVTNELTSLFLGENLKSRERKAQETTAFLKQEADNLSKHIEEIEGKLATFKQKANGALPELVSLNMQLMNQAERELMDLDQQIRSLEERQTYLEGELATIKPHTPIISSTGERIFDSHERLKALRAQYASAASYLSPEHPDIVKMQQELSALEQEVGSSDSREDVSKRLRQERANLASLRDRYAADHPDVVKGQQMVRSLEQELARSPSHRTPAKSLKPENPAYIHIESQLKSTTTSLNALRISRASVKRRLQDYTDRLEKTPQLEPGYLELTRDRDNAARKYEELRSRLMEAQVSEGLEVQRKGERFSLIDPPGLPERPHKPNRPAILLLGLLLAAGGGFGAGAVTEHLDRTIHTADQLMRLTKQAPLAVIPFIPTEVDLFAAIRRRRLIGAASLCGILALLLVGHFFWIPMDVVWYSALRRMGLE